MDTHPPSSQHPSLPSQGLELTSGQPLHRVGSNSIDGTCITPLQVQTSPRMGARSASPSVHTSAKPGEIIQASSGEENPRSVPPSSSVLSTASPRGPQSVSSSPQRPAVSSWSGTITSGSSTGTTSAVGGTTGNSIPVGSPFGRTTSPFSSGLTRVSSGSSINANVQLMTQPSVATSGMTSFSESQPVSVPPSKSFSLSGQLGSLPPFSSATSGLVAQPTLAGSVTNHPPISGASLIGGTQPVQTMVPSIINQGPTPGYTGRVAHRDPMAIVSNAGVDSSASALASLQTTTTISGQPGFQNIKVSATTAPYTLGANPPPSYTAKLPVGNPPSVPAQGMSKSGNYQAAVAAAEFALQQANITAQRGQMRPTAPMLPSGQVPGSVGMPGQPGVGGQMLTAQPTSNPISLPGQQQQMKQPGQSTGMLPTDGSMNNPLSRSLPSSSIPPAFSTSVMNIPSTQLPHGSTMNPIAAGQAHPTFSVSGAQPNISISQQQIPGQQQQTLSGQQTVVGLSRLIFCISLFFLSLFTTLLL